MSERYQNKYRIPSARLQRWDYSSAAAYFITICTIHKEPFFGEIVNGIMHLSRVGVIANVLWYEIKNHAENVELGPFVVTPNHVHGILILNENDYNADVETRHALSLPADPDNKTPKLTGSNRFQNQGKNTVSSIVGSYKSAVTKHARRLGYDFGWQSRFHDHIIRDEQSLKNIQEYIINNPLKWTEDKFFTT